MKENQHYMTSDERQQLEAYLRAKMPIAWIARTMGFCRQTIYNEKKRGLYWHTVDYRDIPRYSADKAQQIHTYNQTAKGRPLKIGHHQDYADRLEELMLGVQSDGTIDPRKRYSPYAALIKAEKEGYPIRVCTSTLYSYIDKGVFRFLTNKDLWEKGRKKKRRQKHIQRIAHPQFPSITNRPMAIEQRQEPGHKEMDLVIGKAKSKAALLTLTDRAKREETIIKIPDKTAASVIKALEGLEGVKTITTDNGPEFLAYQEIRAALHGAEVYYCHSYAAWEKGTNEIHNRMIRRWFPKGTNFDEIDQAELDDLADWMNHYPRRMLGGRSPSEID